MSPAPIFGEALDLKACPFCGATTAYARPSGVRGAVIRCGDCPALVVADYGLRDAIEAWNRRPQNENGPPPVREAGQSGGGVRTSGEEAF